MILKLRKLFMVVVAFVLLFSSLLFVSCKKDDEEKNLAFEEVAESLLDADTKTRVFFNNLDYKYKNDESYSSLSEATSFISTLTLTLGEQMDEYKKAIDAFAGELETSSTEVTRKEDLIKIENETQVFEIMAEENSLKIEFVEDNKSHYVYEFVKKTDDSYFCQVVNLIENKNYKIYQYYFDGASGTLAIGTATSFVSIYKVDLSSSNYPTVSGTIFSS